MPSLRPARRSLVAVAALTGVLLTGCGNDATATTCGEVRAMSDDQRLDLLDSLATEEAAADRADGDDSSPFDGFADASAEDRRTAADGLVSLCEVEGDDVSIQDADGIED